MNDIKVITTRKKLYDLVWSKPIQKLSDHFGYSDKGLAKICKRNEIPCPPRGYWQKMKARLRVKKIPLPVNGSEQLDLQLKYRAHKQAKAKSIKVRHDFKIIKLKESMRGVHRLVSQ